MKTDLEEVEGNKTTKQRKWKDKKNGTKRKKRLKNRKDNIRGKKRIKMKEELEGKYTGRKTKDERRTRE